MVPESSNAPLVEGAGGVVFNPQGDVLLIRHHDGTWVFPKGHIDAGEDELATALREVQEEAGVDARCPEPKRTWVTSYINPRGEHRRITWFRLETDAEAPVMREAQFPEGGFFPPERARTLLSFDEDRTLIENMIEFQAES